MILKYDEWKSRVFDKKLFQDMFEIGKQQKVAATISGVRSVFSNVSSQGLFGHKKSTTTTPELDNKNKLNR